MDRESLMLGNAKPISPVRRIANVRIKENANPLRITDLPCGKPNAVSDNKSTAAYFVGNGATRFNRDNKSAKVQILN